MSWRVVQGVTLSWPNINGDIIQLTSVTLAHEEVSAPKMNEWMDLRNEGHTNCYFMFSAGSNSASSILTDTK